MKFTKSASVEELQVISRFESLRKILLSEQYADHLKKPLAYWALPTDRRLPLAFLGRTLEDLLQYAVCRALQHAGHRAEEDLLVREAARAGGQHRSRRSCPPTWSACRRPDEAAERPAARRAAATASTRPRSPRSFGGSGARASSSTAWAAKGWAASPPACGT